MLDYNLLMCLLTVWFFLQRMEPVGWDSKKNTYWLVGGACILFS